MTHVVKRRGHNQEFDEKKLYASVYASCLSAHATEEEAENIASNVTKEIKDWLKDKSSVNSGELFEQTGKELTRLSKEAALMYITHRDLS